MIPMDPSDGEIIIMYCAIRMYFEMESKVQILSPTLRNLHRQFFKTLVLQVVTPTVTLFAPVTVLIYLPLFDLQLDLPFGIFLSTLSIFPGTDAIIVMYVVQDYSFTHIGSTFFNSRIQQVFGLGLFIQGPMTQMIITVNRFLVIMFSPTSVPKYSTHITVAALSLTWLAGIWWSTIPGFEDNCFVPFTFDHVGFYFTECNQKIVVWVACIIVSLAVFNNTMNIVLGIKLAISAKKMRGISSEVARNRSRQTTRFFIQSCIQDWLTALVCGTNIISVELLCPNNACMHLTTFAVDSMSYTVDGFVMFVFNFKRANKNSIRSNGLKTTKETSSRIVSYMYTLKSICTH
ncbi:hypothetical protein L5515_007189 [Caenorhabditis briggsae]|uniref:7TM GPCR serpentine receptor class x (Srx) domain-containing protein n=1 Tax=Caenorhabditis briggsae TaxID=6238 RepID=A0AAE9F424_CAEBR|nr:hypothetical protein L5515_007189 [Caenorhabditis briggsae]